MTLLEIGLASVLLVENIGILLVSMWDSNHDLERDHFGEEIEESMRPRS